MDKSKIFDGKAKFYLSGRPNYAEELIDTLYTTYGFTEKSVIADIGSGTGIFAAEMLRRHSYVYCVEPNQDMRTLCQHELQPYTNCTIINGHASETGLPPNSVDFVTAAQAFHWFDPDRFRKECQRILRANGKILLVWNMRDNQCPVMEAVNHVHRRYCPDFPEPGQKMAYDDSRILRFFKNTYEKLEFDHPLKYDRNQFISRNLSSSYSLKQGSAHFEAYRHELEDIFEKYVYNGMVSVANVTVTYIGDVQDVYW